LIFLIFKNFILIIFLDKNRTEPKMTQTVAALFSFQQQMTPSFIYTLMRTVFPLKLRKQYGAVLK